VPLPPGSRLADGRFLVHALLGAGAACDSYLVFDALSGGPAGARAVLRLRQFIDPSKHTRVELLRDRFHREIEVRDRLQFAPHTHVLLARELLELPGALGLLVEFAEHGALAERLRTGPPPIPMALHWLRNAAAGLHHLHDHGIVHRDLSPARIFLTAAGDACVGGFGMAQTPRALVHGLVPHPASAYASPEHALPQPLNPASDVYSLGCIAFELLTGRAWVTAHTAVAAPSQLRADVPHWLDEIVMRMLGALPGRPRFTDMRSVLIALQQNTAVSAPTVTPPDSTRSAAQPTWLRARVEGLEAKTEEQQRTLIELATRHRRLKDEVLPRRTFLAGAVGLLIGVAVKAAADRAQSILIQNFRRASAVNEAVELAPGVFLDLAPAPAGRYVVGSDRRQDPRARDDELPQNVVDHAAFWIGRTEVTVAQFAAFVQAQGYRTTAEIDGASRAWVNGAAVDVPGADWAHPRGPNNPVEPQPLHPVTHVSWRDAVNFCAWLARRTGWDVTLPSEAEWEAAARGVDGRIYAWGNEAPENYRANFGNVTGATAQVGWYSNQFAAPCGALDMAGNVWEWTRSRYRPYPYRVDDGREAAEGDEPRALRGGAFDSPAEQMRAAWRHAAPPGAHAYNIGFRVRVRK
jgi:formylglycine-generating enzyme required for sulfatase activity